MTIDLLQGKFDEAWNAQFVSAVKEHGDEERARKWASNVVRRFKKRTQQIALSILEFESAIGRALPPHLKAFFEVADLRGTLIWDADFNLDSAPARERYPRSRCFTFRTPRISAS